MTEQSAFQMRRLGVLMTPEPGNPQEVEGVLNPGGARGRDGAFYLLPRLVGKGNYSRIGIARVHFDNAGDPTSVERLGIALEPETEYETGGCEDPRVSYFSAIDRYVMTYTALSDRGPRVAMALSDDLFTWQRLGLVHFHPYRGTDLGDVPNKDAVVFPDPIPDDSGIPRLVMIDRPLFPESEVLALAEQPSPRTVDLARESLWVSFSHAESMDNLEELCCFAQHYRLASPVAEWERVKVGGGTPPSLIKDGWLMLYHGVSGDVGGDGRPKRLRYSAGVLVLDRHDPRVILYRSPEPILEPELPEERDGLVANVVFPTAIDQRLDLGEPRRLDVYYGMADSRIGVASLFVPDGLPSGAVKDPHSGLV